MASCKFAVVVALVGLVAVCYAAPADKQADVEVVPLEGPEGVAPGAAAPKDLKASSSYGFGYSYPYSFGYPYGGGYPYYSSSYGLGYYSGYYPRYYYGGYHGGYPFYG